MARRPVSDTKPQDCSAQVLAGNVKWGGRGVNVNVVGLRMGSAAHPSVQISRSKNHDPEERLLLHFVQRQM